MPTSSGLAAMKLCSAASARSTVSSCTRPASMAARTAGNNLDPRSCIALPAGRTAGSGCRTCADTASDQFSGDRGRGRGGLRAFGGGAKVVSRL